jgi:hypothetical protein
VRTELHRGSVGSGRIPVAPGDLFACPECGGNGSNSVRTELA